MIEAKIIADSIGPNRARITTFQLKYHRFIHDEFMTHRCFSRNASSQRAIPCHNALLEVANTPALPIYWGKNKKGMQATEELDWKDKQKAIGFFLNLKNKAVDTARLLSTLGLHKQTTSRLLMPWTWIHVVATATDLDGFFWLRCHKDAQPEMQALAVKMARAYRDSTPREVEANDWHLPYIKESDTIAPRDILPLISAARCARVSYKKHDGDNPSIDDDLMLSNTLIRSGHLTPFEHQACASEHPIRSGNLTGWIQYRKRLPNDRKLSEPFDFSILDQFPTEGFLV